MYLLVLIQIIQLYLVIGQYIQEVIVRFNTFKNAYNDQHSNQIINGKTPFEYSEDDDETIYYGYTVSVPSENTRYYYRASSTASVWGKSTYSSKNTRIEP